MHASSRGAAHVTPEATSTATEDPVPTNTAANEPRGAFEWGAMVPFALVHLAVLGAFWSGVTLEAVIVAVVLYWVRMFGVTGGYHRYFAHRTYEMGRVPQFLMAFLAQTSAQRGVLWWAAHHRAHHLYSDTERDLHSPLQRGFWYAHLGWIYDRNSETDEKRIRDFARYPELRFLNRFWLLPPVLLGVAVFALFGWSGLFIGFCLSTVFVWHGTFTINSLSHLFGRRRYDTKDDSRNNWLLAIITMGEGWHNNHHHYMSSCRQGFFPWEYDFTYYTLKALSFVGLVRGIKEPPARVLEAGRRADAERAAKAAMAKAAAAAMAKPIEPAPAVVG